MDRNYPTSVMNFAPQHRLLESRLIAGTEYHIAVHPSPKSCVSGQLRSVYGQPGAPMQRVSKEASRTAVRPAAKPTVHCPQEGFSGNSPRRSHCSNPKLNLLHHESESNHCQNPKHREGELDGNACLGCRRGERRGRAVSGPGGTLGGARC